MTKDNKEKQVARDMQMIAGIEKHLSKGASWIIAGKKYTPAQVVEIFQARIDRANVVLATRATWRGAVKIERAGLVETKQFASAVRQAVLSMFGTAGSTLADFGLSARKPRRELTSDEKVQAVARAKATRRARHTLGKKQKLAITGEGHGNVTPPAPPAKAPAEVNGTG
jgi:hypothetical protein